MSAKNRGIGYCTHVGCPAHFRAFVIQQVGGAFECPVCVREGRVERERAVRRNRDRFYSEVRIEYDFDPLEARYRRCVVVTDGRLLGQQNVYTMWSPLIESERCAREAARVILQKLNRELRAGLENAKRHAEQRGMSSRDQLADEGWPIPS